LPNVGVNNTGRADLQKIKEMQTTKALPYQFPIWFILAHFRLESSHSG